MKSGRTLLICRGCTLAGADFNKAYFRLASLQGADMRQAKLAGADFFRAVGLSTERLAFACGDDKTRLPEGGTIPRCAKTP